MTNIFSTKNKQDKALEGKSEEEKALAAARRAMEELRKKRHLKEPDQIASGKSDEDGNMVIEELTPNDEIDVEHDELKDSHND